MSERTLDISYECLNTSCQVYCKKGVLVLDEGVFEELKEAVEGEEFFRSPSGSCRMGFNQAFKAIKVEDSVDEGDEARSDYVEESPFKMLVDEHKGVLEKLDIIERQVQKRDLDGLWVTTSQVEDDILLHSIKKEEISLFPYIKERVNMGGALVHIMDEDHREFISLLHGFRVGLQDGDILDGMVNSLLVNLRNHIRKEDEELFTMAEEKLSAEELKKLYDEMLTIEKDHIPLEPGKRTDKKLEAISENRDKIDAEIAALKSISSVGGEEMCCGGH